MKYKENRDSVEFDRLHEKDYSDKLIHGYSTLTEFEKAFIGERNMVMAFGIPIKPKRNLNKVGRSEDQSHYDYIGAPGSEEWPIPNTWEVNAGSFGTIKGVYSPIPDARIDFDCSKLSNVNINKCQDGMFSFYSPYKNTTQKVTTIKDKTNSMYRPLPSCLTIKESNIDGLGLFSKESIYLLDNRNPYVWMTHLLFTFNKKYDLDPIEQLFRTPVGGFISHSVKPNCTLGLISQVSTDDFTIKKFFLRPLKDIMAGDELTLDYTKELCGLTGYDGAGFLNEKLEYKVYENSIGT